MTSVEGPIPEPTQPENHQMKDAADIEKEGLDELARGALGAKEDEAPMAALEGKQIKQLQPNLLDTLETCGSPYLTKDTKNLKSVCRLMEETHGRLLAAGTNHEMIKEITDECVRDMLGFERDNDQQWRFVLDVVSVESGFKLTFQVSSPAPNFHRLRMSSSSQNPLMKTAFESGSVEAKPDLSTIKNEQGQSLLDCVKKWDAQNIPRIAVLGAARVMPQHPEEEGIVTPVEDWGTRHARFIHNGLDEIMGVVDHFQGPVGLINGGWQGLQENSVGVPLQAHHFALSSSPPRNEGLMPLTSSIVVMPEGGKHDSNEVAPVQRMGEDLKFIVPGEWGDDSKYLLGISTGALFFEEYGFWTGIEFYNAIEQDKPVVVLEKNPDPNGPDYTELEVTKKDGSKGTYRKYRDAAKATEWLLSEKTENTGPWEKVDSSRKLKKK